MTQLVPSLEAVLVDAWAQLQRGVRDHKHGFHVATVSTIQNGRPHGRSVYLRVANTKTRQLAFHSDARSSKVTQLDQGMAWTLYDPELDLQVRAWGPTKPASAYVIDEQWHWSDNPARKHYLTEPGPGVPVETATNGFSGDLANGRIPATVETEPARNQFTVLVTDVQEFDVLHKRADGNRRARFVWTGERWESTWLAP
jgi:hypothetical protein